MKECPCINCLILPICKAKVNKHMKGYSNLHIIAMLKPKCSLIAKWIDEFNIIIIFRCLTAIYRI